jgi:hypothetical protein
MKRKKYTDPNKPNYTDKTDVELKTIWNDWFRSNTIDLTVHKDLYGRDGKMILGAAKANGYELVCGGATSHLLFRKTT